MLVVAVGVGLLIRFKCNQSDKPAQKPPPREVPIATVTTDAAVVEPPVMDAAIAIEPDEPPPPEKPRYDGPPLEIGALSADGKRALLVTLEGQHVTPRLRVVVIDTGAVETDVELAALDMIEDPKSEAVISDLVRARAVLRGFPLGTHRFARIASSSDGARGAFNVGDPLHLVDGDKLGAKLALPAAYDPMITPDNMLLMRGYDGRIDGEGKYSLFAVPLTGGKPKKIAGTDGIVGRWVVHDHVLRTVVSQLPAIATCVLEIPLTKPYKVTSRVCPEAATSDDIALSPSGTWVTWVAGEGEDRRVRSMELATKRVDMDVEQSGFANISDDGHVVFSQYDSATVWDPKSKELRESAAAIDHGCVFRTATELVCPDGGSVRVERLSP